MRGLSDFEVVQPGWPWAVSISGKKARQWDYYEYGRWSRGERLLNMRNVWFERVQQRDVTGSSRRDFILHGGDSDGYSYGSLLVNQGDGARVVTFTDADGRYGALFLLQAVGFTLFSDYGARGHMSSGGCERTMWVRKPGDRCAFVEKTA